jgi:O-antigen ligase
MALTFAIILIAVGALIAIALIKGFEAALPFFAFLVILLPAEARIDFGGMFELTATRAIAVTLLVLYIVFGKQHPQHERDARLPLKVLLILYAGWCMVSTVNSIVFATSLKTVLESVLEFYLVYTIFAKSVTSVQTVHKILAASVAALALCCVFGVVEQYAQWKVISLFPEVAHRFVAGVGGRLPDSGRIKATFPHPILFANALALGIPWALCLLSLAKTTAQKACLWAAIILMCWNMYKTMSRGPWMALALSLLLLLLFASGGLRKHLAVIALLTVSALIIRPGVGETLRNTYIETLDPESARGGSYQYRYDLARLARQTLAQDPRRAVWGFGPNSFPDLGLEAENPDTGHWDKFESCDSAFVEVALDTGYVGLFLVAALLLRAALLAWKGFRTISHPANFLCLLFLINIGAYALMMLSVENFGWGQQTLMLWILIALSVVYPRLAEVQDVTAALRRHSGSLPPPWRCKAAVT